MSAKLRIFGIVFIFLFLSNTPLWAESSPAPRVWSIEAAQQTELSANISYTVTFSEPVSGVTMDDFAIAGDTMHVTIVAVNAVAGGGQYTVHINVDGDNRGFALALFDDDSIKNTAQIPLGGIGNQNGNALGNRIHPTNTIHSSKDIINSQRSGMQKIHERVPSAMLGWYPSIALTSDGLPVIAHYDALNQYLKLALCLDSLCQNVRNVTPDPTTVRGMVSSLALTTTDIPLISYYNYSDGDLMYLYCGTTNCKSPSIRTIDSGGTVGEESSLAITASGTPVISYFDTTNNSIKIATCTNATCSSSTITTILGTGTVAGNIDMALSTNGYPVVTYTTSPEGAIKLAICNSLACDAPQFRTLGIGPSKTSVAITSDNKPVVSFYSTESGRLILIMCGSATCATSTDQQIDTVGVNSSVSITSTDLPIISYYDSANWLLKMATCDTSLCANPFLATIDALPVERVGYHNDITIDAENLPVVAYSDYFNNSLNLYRRPVTLDKGKPNSFAKSSPPDTYTLSTTEVHLEWDGVPNADSYSYCIAPITVTCVSWVSTGTARNAVLTNLTNKTTYHWQVRATNTIGTTIADAGVEHSFTVSLPPGEFTKTSPAQNAVNQKTSVTLSWGASPYATTYEYCIAATAAACKTWKSTGTARSVVVTGLAKNKIFYWNVRARNEISATNASGTAWKFTTAK